MNITLKTSAKIAVLRPLAALLLMVVVMTFLSDNFATSDNLFNVLRQVSVNLCISVGMTMIILTGGIDLSVGSILAFSGAIAAGFLRNGISLPGTDTFIGFTFLGCILAALVVGGALGFFNGLMVTKFKVPPFVATLAMLTIARGLTMLYTNGYPITGLGDKFSYLGTGWFLGVPMPVWIALIIILGFIFFIRKSKTGRYIYAIGGNEKATLLSGININKVKILVYTLTGVLCAVAGLLVTARLDSAQPNAGSGYELDSIAAVVIGGTSLSGGKGTIMGTVIGALIIGTLNNGLVLLDISPFWQQVVKGFVILLAVVMDRMNTKQ
ncbi:ribose ABC transporter permease [Bacteroides sp. 214]|uniref:ABC transporter permease n=1 Tax=Bacteroides sp. 214 TaxID=2302935 RepID=UPI0013D39C67|nr:ribose ABC transporter permease [Bacteroides sp. 214]NDW13623.1 ribose ABC transporter permease [Bacteroides sp. 214]